LSKLISGTKKKRKGELLIERMSWQVYGSSRGLKGKCICMNSVIVKGQESRDGTKEGGGQGLLPKPPTSIVHEDEGFPIHYPFISSEPLLCSGFVCMRVRDWRWRKGLAKP